MQLRCHEMSDGRGLRGTYLATELHPPMATLNRNPRTRSSRALLTGCDSTAPSRLTGDDRQSLMSFRCQN